MTGRSLVPRPPGVRLVVPAWAHGAAVGLVVLSVVLAAPVASGQAWALWVVALAALACATVLVGFATEQGTFCWGGPKPPRTTLGILRPRPAPRAARASTPPALRVTPRGLVRRARLWITADEVGIIDRLHGESTWPRAGAASVERLRVVTMDGGPLRVDLLDPAGKLLASLPWARWFPSDSRVDLDDLAALTGMVVDQRPWSAASPEHSRWADASDRYTINESVRRTMVVVAQALALAVPGLVLLLGTRGVDVHPVPAGAGVLVLLAAVVTVVLALLAGWDDQRDTAGESVPEPRRA